MPSLIMDQVPIHLRRYDRISRPQMYVGETDLELAWIHLNPSPHKLRGAYSLLSQYRPPRITFVGSSHVYHLSDIYNKKPAHYSDFDKLTSNNLMKCGGLPANHRKFLSLTRFVSCGGLKWATALDELNGRFNSLEKWRKYGNQWQKYDATNTPAEYYVIILGSNDADDYFHRTLVHLSDEHEHTYLTHVEQDAQEWKRNLKPVIKTVLKELTDHAPQAKLAYLRIIQRDYWNAATRDFTDKLDYYISAELYKEGGPKIRCLESRSIYNYVKKYEVPAHQNDDVITAFLQSDGLHLNNWGYEAVLNDIAPNIMSYWSSVVRQW